MCSASSLSLQARSLDAWILTYLSAYAEEQWPRALTPRWTRASSRSHDMQICSGRHATIRSSPLKGTERRSYTTPSSRKDIPTSPRELPCAPTLCF